MRHLARLSAETHFPIGIVYVLLLEVTGLANIAGFSRHFARLLLTLVPTRLFQLLSPILSRWEQRSLLPFLDTHARRHVHTHTINTLSHAPGLSFPDNCFLAIVFGTPSPLVYLRVRNRSFRNIGPLRSKQRSVLTFLFHAYLNSLARSRDLCMNIRRGNVCFLTLHVLIDSTVALSARSVTCYTCGAKEDGNKTNFYEN